MAVNLIEMKSRYEGLTATEKKVMDVILSDPDAVTDLSTSDLADLAGVAPATVIRLSKSLGFDGYSHLKISLSRELGKRDNERNIGGVFTMPDDGGVAGAFSRVFQSCITALQDTAKMIVPADVERVVAMLAKARRIYFFGVGTSATVAEDAHYRLLQLGYNTCAFTDELYMRVAASNMNQDDVAVCISHSGSTTTTADAMALAKKNGAKGIAITSYRSSALCACADASIVVFADDYNYPVEAVSARIAHISVLDAVAVALACMKPQETKEHLQRRNKALQKIRGEYEK